MILKSFPGLRRPIVVRWHKSSLSVCTNCSFQRSSKPRSIQELLRALIHSETSRLNGDASAASNSDQCLVATRASNSFFVDLDLLLKVDHPFVRTVHVWLCTHASGLPCTRQRHHRNICQNVGFVALLVHGPSLCDVLSASILPPPHVTSSPPSTKRLFISCLSVDLSVEHTLPPKTQPDTPFAEHVATSLFTQLSFRTAQVGFCRFHFSYPDDCLSPFCVSTSLAADEELLFVQKSEIPGDSVSVELHASVRENLCPRSCWRDRITGGSMGFCTGNCRRGHVCH